MVFTSRGMFGILGVLGALGVSGSRVVHSEHWELDVVMSA